MFACIRYHVDWPSPNDPFYLYNPAENGIRTGYYGITGVPHTQVGGLYDAGGYNQYWTVISNRYTEPSPLEIGLSGTFNEASREGVLDVTVTATDNISLDGLFLRIVLTESDIYWHAPNNVNYHNQTMRHMFPYSLGTRIYIDQAGEVVELSEDFWCPEPLVIENCELVVFVQSEQNRESLQAAKISLNELTWVGIDDRANLPGKFKLGQNYPNPFNVGTVIDYVIEEESRIELAVYDILGKRIATLVSGNKDAGRYSITWNGLSDSGEAVASGLYFYSLSSGSGSETKRMMLLK